MEIQGGDNHFEALKPKVPYAGELRFSLNDRELLDEIATASPELVPLLNDEKLELVLCITPCRIGAEHANRLGGRFEKQGGFRIQIGFLPNDIDSPGICSNKPLVAVQPFFDGEREYADLRFQPRLCERSHVACMLFKPKEVQSKLNMPPPPSRPASAMRRTPTSDSVETVDAEDPAYAEDFVWLPPAADLFCNSRAADKEWATLHKKVPKARGPSELKFMANFAIMGVSCMYLPFETHESEVYFVVSITYRGRGMEILMPASGITTEKDLSDILTKHNPLLEVAGFTGSDVSSLRMFLKEKITDDTPRVPVGARYGQNGDFVLYDDGWTVDLRVVRANGLKPWLSTAESGGLQLPENYKKFTMDMDGHVPTAGNAARISMLNALELLLFMVKTMHDMTGCA